MQRHPTRIWRNPVHYNFRSKWELAYAQYLTVHKIQWLYEPFCFFVGEGPWTGKGYCPDFYLPATQEFIEIKGKWLGGAEAKVAQFRFLYPQYKLTILHENELVNLGIIKRWKKMAKLSDAVAHASYGQSIAIRNDKTGNVSQMNVFAAKQKKHGPNCKCEKCSALNMKSHADTRKQKGGTPGHSDVMQKQIAPPTGNVQKIKPSQLMHEKGMLLPGKSGKVSGKYPAKKFGK
jgi:hypothetical protein